MSNTSKYYIYLKNLLKIIQTIDIFIRSINTLLTISTVSQKKIYLYNNNANRMKHNMSIMILFY